MIDTTRWVLLEAWMALGLRIRWAASYEIRSENADDWFQDEETNLRYRYEGHGVWSLIRPSDQYRRVGYPTNDAPTLGYEAMRHELAHYLVANEERREQKNFGLAASSAGDADDEQERRALQSEQVLDAMTRGAARIFASIDQPKRGRP